ncbi:MAG: hypothetical protein HY331_13255 [Chloroflexi bacterium]|nr:hypothetical protein [Chloroflexota bacterium]
MTGQILELIAVLSALSLALLTLGSYVAIQRDGFPPRFWFTALTIGMAGVLLAGLLALISFST